LSFEPKIPKRWKSYSFKVNFRGRVIKVIVTNSKVIFETENNKPIKIKVNNNTIEITSNNSISL